MISTKFVVYKKASLSRLLDGCGAAGKTVSEIAYIFWEKSGKPEGKEWADYFWREAEKIKNPPPPPVRETDWVCSSCGNGCYFDGRCGDGPIHMCGCDGRYGATAVPKSQYKGKSWW